MDDAAPEIPTPQFDAGRPPFLFIATVSAAFIAVSVEAAMNGDWIRFGVSGLAGIAVFIVAILWHVIATKIPKSSARFITSISSDTRVWAFIIVCCFLYVIFPFAYAKIWGLINDPTHTGVPAATIQFDNDPNSEEIIHKNAIEVLVKLIYTQTVKDGECHSPDPLLPSNDILNGLSTPTCTPAKAQDAWMTEILLAVTSGYKFSKVNISAHGAAIPKSDTLISGRQAVILFRSTLENVVLDLSVSE